jgi:short-subunit dehydrogenase
MELRGSSVLLTGATGGLGAAIARALHREGASLVLTGRKQELLDPLAAELDAVAAPCDLTDRASLNALLAAHGNVDILVANAGVPATGNVDTYSEDEMDRVIEANLTAPLQMVRALLPGMLERGRGHIVLVSSLGGKVATPSSSMYSATKFGLRGFGLALAQDVAGTGVGASVLTLGFIRDAGMFSKSGGPEVLPPGVGTSSPEEVAAAAVTAIRKNRTEITVAPVPMKLGAVFGSALPRVAAAAQKASGGHAVAEKMGEAQSTWRS